MNDFDFSWLSVQQLRKFMCDRQPYEQLELHSTATESTLRQAKN
jgi:hypothetical protein